MLHGACIFIDSRLDFSRLDAVTPDLELPVDAAEAFERAVGALSSDVAGPIDPKPGEWRTRDAAGSAPPSARPAMIAAAKTDAADIELAGFPGATGSRHAVEDQHLAPGKRRPYRHRSRTGAT